MPVLVLVGASLSPSATRAARGQLVAPPALRFERVDTTYGFPQSSTYGLVEQTNGYLWATTLDGLVRFDGFARRIHDRNTDPGILTTRMTALFAHEPTGDLWIGTEDGRVIRKRGDAFSTLFEPRVAQKGVTGVAVSDDGRRLFVADDSGLQELQIVDDARPVVEPGRKHPGISRYSCNTAVVGARQLGYVSDGELVALPLPAPLVDKTDQISCRGNHHGILWLRAPGTELYRVDDDQITVEPRSAEIPASAQPMLEDADGNLWLRFGGLPHLARLDPAGNITRYGERHGLDPLADPITALVDREGGLWFGTTLGLYRYRGEAIDGLNLRTDDGDEIEVSSVYEARDRTKWLVTRDARLAVLRRDGELTEFSALDESGFLALRPELSRTAAGAPWSGRPKVVSAYTAFREDRAGRLWIGTNMGLVAVHADGHLVIYTARFDNEHPGEIDGAINDILVEDEGLWLATSRGLVRFEGDRQVRVWGSADGIDAPILTLLRGRDGALWIGTRDAVLRFVGDRVEPVAGLDPLGQARALHEDAEGRLWIGTYDSGLFRRLSDGTIEHVGPAEGFPSGAFTLRFDNRGYLWTTSNRGLSRTRVADLERALGRRDGLPARLPTTLYDHRAGLPAAECNGGFGTAGYPCDDDAWCVHTMGGVAVARLDAIRVVDIPPIPVLDEVLVDREPRPLTGSGLELRPDDLDVVLRYGGIAFEGAADVRFRHRLVGHNNHWIDDGHRRELLFSDLPPGTYTFELIAENREGIASPEPLRLAITVAPAWWERPIVLLAGLFLTLGLVSGAVRWRLLALQRRHQREERALRETAELLEARVRERTAVLDAEVQERRRAEVAAYQASAVKSQFIAQMSHELRTPMNAIIGLSDLLARTGLSDEQRTWVRTVRASGGALLTLIEDILDFSRLEAGGLELEHREFDPAGLIDEAVAIVRTQAAAKGLALSWSAAGVVPTRVVGDPDRLRQILLNLLANAVKFTPAGAIDVTLAVAATDNGWRLTIAVRDTGIGIPADQRARIFEPFVQADASISRRFGGSGLGLSITRRLVDAFGGALRLESEVGVGSTFTVEIPVGRHDTAATSGALAIPEVPADPARPLRILVTEDEPINQIVAKAMLSHAGHACTLASSGDEALARLAETDVDIVLMDLNMPGTNGFEATRRIRAEFPAARQPWIIALTAAATVEERRNAFAAGVDDFLSKPVREAALVDALARATRSHPQPGMGRSWTGLHGPSGGS